MEKTLLKLILFSILISISAITMAQKKSPARTADEAFEENKYIVAIERYKKAYSKTKNNSVERDRILYQLAECYRLTNNFKRSEFQYKRLVKEGYEKKKPDVLLHYANALKINEKYEEALVQYQAFTELVPEDPRGPNGIKSCEMIIEWLENPSKHDVEYIKKLSSREADFAPTYANDNFNALIFTSSREGSTGKATDEWTDENFSDLYISRLDRKEEWSQPVLLDNADGEAEEGEGEPTTINTSSNEGAPTMTSDYKTMYFTRCPNENQAWSGCQVYSTKVSGRTWSEPTLVMIGNDTNAIIGHPTISQDELTIYFASARSGGSGGKDLWLATRENPTEDFGRIFNLGPVINTPGDEMFPYLKNDTVLYFASNGHPGMGGLDIFKSTLNDEGQWGAPENLRMPLNSNYDDFGIVFRPDRETGFFSSNRKRGRDDDIYSFNIPPVEFTMTGTITNDRTLQYVEGANVEMVGSNGTSVSTRSSESGVYMFGISQVLPNTTYELIVTKKDYFTGKGTVTTVGLERSKELVHDFLLQPIPDEPVVLPEILYDLDSYVLLPQYEDSLQGLIETLDDNETIVIELASHTDSRASNEYNDILSQRRAQSVVDYLVDRGIDPERMVAKGYGERTPRILLKDITRDGYLFVKDTELTEEYIDAFETEDEQEAAHQLNRRTEFRVIRKDFVPKPKTELTNYLKIDVVTDPDNTSVYFTTDPKTGAISAQSSVNGYSIPFTYDRNHRASISMEQALDLLNKGAITKNDFEGDPNEVLKDGLITNYAKLNINELMIGNISIFDVTVFVDHRLKYPLVLGHDILSRIGDYTIDRTVKAIMFKNEEE